MYLIFDTETTGLPKDYNAPITDTENWPRCIQIAWQLHDSMGNLIEHKDFLVKPDGFDIPFQSEQIHGISTELATEQGIPLQEILEEFKQVLDKAKFVVGQNVGFDINIMGCEFYRNSIDSPLTELPVLDTCTEVTAQLCQIPGGRGGKFKLPTLTELHEYLFGTAFSEAHNATADVEATTRCFLELVRRESFSLDQLQEPKGYFEEFKTANPEPIDIIGLKHLNLKAESEKLKKKAPQTEEQLSTADLSKNLASLKDVSFTHLHTHTQYSILQSTTRVDELISQAANFNMPAVALTDLGNMMAAFQFVEGAIKHNKKVKAKNEELVAEGKEPTKKEIKPIVGCEFFVCKDRLDKSIKDNGYQVVMLAKNKNGYHNLAKMASSAFVEGFYYVPRIDKNLILEYKDDIIVTSGGLRGEISDLILNTGEAQAEEALLWWKEHFKDDFYIELVRHNLEEEERVNQVLLKFAKKHNIKYFAANNTFYNKRDDSKAHDILLCVKEGEKQSTPIGRGRGFRFGFPNDEFYFKSSDEMKELFKDLPEAIVTTNEIVEKIEVYGLARDVLLPAFEIPEQFQDPEDAKDGGKRGENNYLRHLTYEGAKKRYGDISEEIKERLDFELATIANTGYPGYFLIVQDFCQAARDMGVSVGPGRGSAAGSAVAYCIGITNVDPIKYDLLFERFLNPDRVSMPDIDIDFDDEGRSRVIDYVIDKYGSSQVAQIITYGTMAAKSSIRDTGRVLDLPLPDTDRLAKLLPDIKLGKLFKLDEKGLKDKAKDKYTDAVEFIKIAEDGRGLEAETINNARVLEGSVRNTGIHACGVIITPSDIREHVPVAKAKDSDMWCTQFDNSVVESAGLLKMDFLGLKTLTLIKDTLKIVKARHGVEIDIESIPLDDEETYGLFQRGETVGIFQYESPGMQKHLKALKPTVFADLIAMNALYRPGPLEYIPDFIKRKHGEQEIIYDLEDCKEYLEETYGITVYQEQVMLLSQKLAGFTKGEADVLRKAMGKKQKDVLDKMKPKFIAQANEKGHPEDKLEKIWKDWEAFAAYAFNKSHSTCYAWIAYQTAYLKAHYPAEYMAAVLSNNMNDIKSVTFFMEECKRMGLNVLGPDVNESYYKFAVNKEGAVRFGLGAVKGVGESAVESIVNERKKNGSYESIFDFVKRIDLKSANKKTFESLVLAGGFDSFQTHHRAQFFAPDEKGTTYLESILKFGNGYQQSLDAPPDLFGETHAVELNEPTPPVVEPWSNLKELSQEKDVVGVYISGHPLDDYKVEINNFCSTNISRIVAEQIQKNRDYSFAGIVTEVNHRVSKTGKPFGIFTIEDYTESLQVFLFSQDYVNFKSYLNVGWFLFVKGRYQAKRFNKEEFEFKITSMDLLTDIRDKMAKNIVLNVQLSDLNDKMVEQLSSLVDRYQGNCRLKLQVEDRKEKMRIDMPSKRKSVNPTNEFLKELEKTSIGFKITS